MKKIVFAVMGLLALFTILRSYGQAAAGGTRYVLEPGVLEIDTAEGSARIAFGLLERGRGQPPDLEPVPHPGGAFRRQAAPEPGLERSVAAFPRRACGSAGPCGSPGRSRGT